MKRLSLLVVVAVCGALSAPQARACRYNVRDVGFVDLGSKPYVLYLVVGSETEADQVATVKRIAGGVLLDSNVTTQVIDGGDLPDLPAFKHPTTQPAGGSPAAVLVSPDGRGLTLALTQPGMELARSARLALERVVDSPVREQLIAQAIRHYGVILLVEGTDVGDNAEAKTAAEDAVQDITLKMQFLPKRIAEPPVVLTVEQKDTSRERVLLWSLGIDERSPSRPSAGVVFGRGRLIGPRLADDQITALALANILAIVGADCECGLDREWMTGMLLPARWPRERQAKAADELGFDPENPMVKAEMSSILRRGPSGGGPRQADLDAPRDPLFGYNEIVVDLAPPADDSNAAPAPDAPVSPTRTADSAVTPTVVAARTPPAEKDRPFKTAALVFAGLCAVVVLASIGIMLRTRRSA